MTARGLSFASLFLLLAGPAQARTITLTAEDCDELAFLSAKAPRLSWAGELGTGIWFTEPSLHIWPDTSVLMRFSLTQIPKGQRITKAELSFSTEYVAGNPHLSVRRLLAEWGHGVCYQYRMTFPQKVEWAKPGGLGASTDRAAKDSAVFKVEKTGEHTVDVTEDVELWYTGATANRGWILAIENNSGPLYVTPPYTRAGGSKTWKLTITFEPL
jgi:hypothetical protein